ncbi:hypothetical protein [Bartonella sp. ML70XJBT]|uniref:hypothetical protein n=1 Tax=Bartonella sp. ML70XJBT TaxID=3019096 RepID=UPI002361268E|nr:hypothetical protein [Bartonella sp. ML70XJBT]
MQGLFQYWALENSVMVPPCYAISVKMVVLNGASSIMQEASLILQPPYSLWDSS